MSGSTRRGFGRFVLPAMGLGCLAAGLVIMGTRSGRTIPESQVVRDIRAIILQPPGPTGEAGGSIGPWWISAVESDPITGDLTTLAFRSGNMRLVARHATLSVDPATDSFSFDCYDIVMVRLPAEDQDDDPHFVHRLDHFVLGPVPYALDIVADGSTSGSLVMAP